MKVGVIVSVGGGVRVGVAVEVKVGGANLCVSVAAAFAVCTMAVSGAFGSSVGMGADLVGKVGTQANMKRIVVRNNIIFLFRGIIFLLRSIG